MTNQQILEKAIQKAVDGGLMANDDEIAYYTGSGPLSYASGHYMELIFNHKFAKALWGTYLANGKLPEVPHINSSGTMFFIKQAQWKYHLQQMVIADDSIKYLGENI